LAYTLTYTNSGDGYAATANLTATRPDGTTYYSCEPAPCGLIGDDIISWYLGRLLGNSAGQATLAVSVTKGLISGTILIHSARLTAPAEVVTALVEITTTVSSQPLLWVQMDNDRTSVDAGDRVTYTLDYGNDGNSDAYDTTIFVILPDLPFVNPVGCQPADQCVYVGDAVTFDLDRLPAGGRGTAYGS
jgi:uncharacterized repeat protein (TIGR01451 family)